MADTWCYTLRLDQRLAEDLETVAVVDGMSIVDTVRQAVQAYLDARRAGSQS